MLHRRGVLPLFRDQHWVASRAQLGRLGVGDSSLRDACRAGLVDRVAVGVVGVSGAWDTFVGRAMALQLATGPDGFLSGRTAARLWGLRQMPEEPVERTIHETRHRPMPAWARLAKTAWDDGEDRPPRPDGLIVASPLRTLFGLAAQLNQYRFERAAEDAWHLGLVTPTDAQDYLARVRRQGRTGVARFETWLERTSERRRPATTGLEQLLAALAERAGLPEPVRQHPLVLANGEVIHLDLAWPDVRLAVEPGHSWWHGGDRAQRADQDRDRACAEVGWLVVRCDESAWNRQARIVAELGNTYRRRRQDVTRV